jgi:uncharacterized membrane protein YphA (DoxX/SURF4 family)
VSRRPEPLSSRTLAAFLEGEVTRSEAAEIEAQLRDCAVSRRRLDRLDELRGALTAVPEELDGVDLIDGVRQAIAAAPPLGGVDVVDDVRRVIAVAPPREDVRARRTVWRRTATFAAAAVVMAVVAGVAVWRSAGPAPVEEGVRAKSAAPGVAEDRWVGIDVFRLGDDGLARPLGNAAQLRSGDGLVLRYTNLGREPFGYVMVFAVDAARAVHWYYPAYEVAGSDPTSVGIQRGNSIALEDAVRHDLPPGPLIIYGLFTRAPLGVGAVERTVAAVIAHGDWDAAAPPRLPIEGSGQHIVRIDVTR